MAIIYKYPLCHTCLFLSDRIEVNLRSRAYLHWFAYLNEGVDREEFATSACALSSTLVGMCKRNVLGSMRMHTLIHLNLFVRTTVSGFWRTPSFSRKSTQVLYLRLCCPISGRELVHHCGAETEKSCDSFVKMSLLCSQIKFNNQWF